MGNSSEKKTMEKRSAEQILQYGLCQMGIFLVVTIGAIAVWAAAFLFSLGIKMKGYKITTNGKRDMIFRGMLCLKKFSVTDWFVLTYAIIVWISTLLSPYREQVIWGYRGWYMGLVHHCINF